MKKIVTARKDELMESINKIKCFFNATDKDLFKKVYDLEKEMEEILIKSDLPN